jgi:transcriptional regulator with XRE-family HTH domain
VNIHSSLIAELRDKSYRDAYVASRIKIGLPFQARALRKSRGWTQEQLAEHAQMSQPRIAEIEKASERRFNLETLLRIASAFDVGLEVNFVPISEIVDDEDAFDPDNFSIPAFTQELSAAEENEKAEQDRTASADLNKKAWGDLDSGWEQWHRLLDQIANSARGVPTAFDFTRRGPGVGVADSLPTPNTDAGERKQLAQAA